MSATHYVLLASVYFQRQDDGSRKRFRRGDVIEGLSANQAERLLKIGAIGDQDDLVATAPAETPSEGTDADPAGSDRPGEGANKTVLVNWIFDNVTKPDGTDYTKTELNRMKVDDLRAIIDSVEG